MIRRTRWFVAQGFARIGPLGICGALLVIAGILTWPLYFWPQARAARQLDASTIATADAPESGAGPMDNSPQAQMRSFYAILPDVRDIPQVLQTIHAAALKQGFDLSEAQLKLQTDANATVARYEMVFPIKAAYPATRDFVSQVMREIPALALEEMRLQRSDPDSSILESRIAFVLFLRAPGGTDQ